MANAKQIARERAEEAAPLGQCSFCGEDEKPVVASEDRDDVAICETCCDGAIRAFMSRSSFLVRAGRDERRDRMRANTPLSDDIEGMARLFDRKCAACGADFFTHDRSPPHECVDTECEGFRAKV